MKLTNPLRYAAGLALVGVLLSALIIYVERTMILTTNRNQPYIALGEYLKNISTKSHLWFEEAMAGDNSIDIEKDVYGYLDKSITTLKAALNGEDTPLGKFYPPQDIQTRKILEESIEDVTNLKIAAKERWSFKQKASIAEKDSTKKAAIDNGESAGGDLDQKFDAAYEELQETYDRMVNHVKANVESDNAILNSLSWTSIILVILVFTGLCFVLYKIQFKNDSLITSNSQKLDEESTKMREFSKFIQAIAGGHYDHHLHINDEMGQKLVAMRDTLKENAEKEQIRIWASTGMAKIGEILRSNYNKATDLYDNILRFVVDYTNSNQASLYILNDEDGDTNHLDLVATYAFHRKKFIQNRVQLGEGLVGQCFLEGKTIFMLDLPKDYIKITSGLGEANPTALIIIPLKINETIYGILEMATFKRFQPHEIELIEKFAESIASTISSVRVNERTRILLEKTQQQAEEMRAQEEEMRQNMEELSATQEEMARKEREYINRIQELEDEMRINKILHQEVHSNGHHNGHANGSQNGHHKGEPILL